MKENVHLPQFIAIAGGPGAGKSFFFDILKRSKQLPIDFVVHDPDIIMESIPAFQEEAGHNPTQAFKRWEIPAREIANEHLHQAITNQRHIVYIRSFALQDSLACLQRAKDAGYLVVVHLLRCNIEIAVSRVESRKKISNRALPLELIQARHESVEHHLPAIRQVANYFFTYENNVDGAEPILISKN